MNKYQEALDILRNIEQSHNYKQIGSSLTPDSDLLQELVDKETPKKPIERLFERNKHFKVCPSCWEKDIKTFVYGKYCDECGQRLE